MSIYGAAVSRRILTTPTFYFFLLLVSVKKPESWD